MKQGPKKYMNDVRVSGDNFQTVEVLKYKRQKSSLPITGVTSVASTTLDANQSESVKTEKTTFSKPKKSEDTEQGGRVFNQIVDSLTLYQKIKYGLEPPEADAKYRPPVVEVPFAYIKSHVRNFIKKPLNTC